MATNTLVTFTHNIWTATNSTASALLYEKYDTKGINFDLSGLHNFVDTYSIVVTSYLQNSGLTVNRDIDIGLAPYTTGQSTPTGITSTVTLRTSVKFNINQSGTAIFTYTYTGASAIALHNCLDKPFYICNYGILNANGQSMSQPQICQVIRKYNIPTPVAGESISHSGLASFTTWCKMATASHTTTNTVISASESNRPWGTSATLINNSGSTVTTSSTYSKTAGTSIQPSWVTAVFSACNDRVWTR